jgi:preprotein translocase subunit YajC
MMDGQSLMLPLLIVMVGAMLFFSTRKQRRAAQEAQKLQTSLQPGDRVMTTSGLYGTIASVDDEATIDIEIAPGVVTTWLRAAVREKVNPVIEEAEEDTDEAEAVAGEPAGTAEIAAPLEHDKSSR